MNSYTVLCILILDNHFQFQFIDERLDLLNSGRQQSDDFELELSLFCDKVPSKMKDMFVQFKKEGGAIMKSAKKKVSTEKLYC